MQIIKYSSTVMQGKRKLCECHIIYVYIYIYWGIRHGNTLNAYNNTKMRREAQKISFSLFFGSFHKRKIGNKDYFSA